MLHKGFTCVVHVGTSAMNVVHVRCACEFAVFSRDSDGLEPALADSDAGLLGGPQPPAPTPVDAAPGFEFTTCMLSSSLCTCACCAADLVAV